MNNFPKLQPGDVVWRPLVVHGATGLTPQGIRLACGVGPSGEIWKIKPALFVSVWGDKHQRGELPYREGWRVCSDLSVGVWTQCFDLIPGWSHFTIQKIERLPLEGKSRTVALATCHTDGFDQLYENIVSLKDIGLYSKIPANLFDRQLYDQNVTKLANLDGVSDEPQASDAR